MDHEQKRLELVSRFVIFVPLLVLLIGFLISSKQTPTVTLSERITPTISTKESVGKKNASSQIKLNLNGPYQCIYNDEAVEANVFVKNKKVKAVIVSKDKISNILVNGDCAYQWIQDQTTGEKTCNIGQYISMAEMFASMNLLGFDSLLSMADTKLERSMPIDSSVLSSVAETCKKQEVNDTQFDIPTNILFTERETLQPSISP